MSQQVKLRPHHLLCSLTYKGAGYTAAFSDNFSSIIDAINGGALIKIVSGPDDICGALRQGVINTCDAARYCPSDDTKARDAKALKDIARFLRRPGLKSGDFLAFTAGTVARLRHAFVHKAIRGACTRCSWHNFCSKIANEGFEGTLLTGARSEATNVNAETETDK